MRQLLGSPFVFYGLVFVLFCLFAALWVARRNISRGEVSFLKIALYLVSFLVFCSFVLYFFVDSAARSSKVEVSLPPATSLVKPEPIRPLERKKAPSKLVKELQVPITLESIDQEMKKLVKPKKGKGKE